MAYGAIKMMQAENRLKDYAFHFFIELGALGPATAMTYGHLKSLGFGATEAGLEKLQKNGVVKTEDGRLYLDIQIAKGKIKRSIAILWILVLATDIVFSFIISNVFFVQPISISFILLNPLALLLWLVAIPISIYTLLPIRKLNAAIKDFDSN